MEAWKNLAEMYTVGRGVPRNEATAKAIIKMLKKVQTEEKNALVARNLVYHVDPGAEQVLYLKGFNYDGAKLSYTITTLPLNGEVYQLSDIYSEYG
ncbi:Hypothetical protein PHPALM_3024, partial [Phytophthora palmivora]